ncbi:MAG: hypothetical protein V1944_00545 [Candidatus Aenigmatarchaeota archaeon]
MIETVSLFQDGTISPSFPYLFDSNTLISLKQSMHRLGCKRRHSGIHTDYDRIALGILNGKIPCVPMTLDTYVEFYVKTGYNPHKKRSQSSIFHQLVRSEYARFVLLDIPKKHFRTEPYSLVEASREDISNTIAAACIRLNDGSTCRPICIVSNDRDIGYLKDWYRKNKFPEASRFHVMPTRTFVRELEL